MTDIEQVEDVILTTLYFTASVVRGQFVLPPASFSFFLSLFLSPFIPSHPMSLPDRKRKLVNIFLISTAFCALPGSPNNTHVINFFMLHKRYIVNRLMPPGSSFTVFEGLYQWF